MAQKEQDGAAAMTPSPVFDAFTKLNLGKEPTFCRICRRLLPDPESIKKGIGPECAQKEFNVENALKDFSEEEGA